MDDDLAGEAEIIECMCGLPRVFAGKNFLLICVNCDSVQDVERLGGERKITSHDSRYLLAINKKSATWYPQVEQGR